MTWIKSLFFIIFFYFLSVFQKTFLIHFSWQDACLNLSLILIIVLFFQRNRGTKDSFLISIFAGFFLDIFSSYFFGLHILIFSALYYLIQKLKKYFLINHFFTFCIILFCSLAFYSLVYLLIGCGFNIFDILYNFSIGILFYFIVKFVYVFTEQWFKK
jgi:rod shape-determining protein MreD